jgi:non-ribosomal peptide synthetase component E (peptide arylation enzyme)
MHIPTEKLEKALYCTSDIVHKDEDGDYQVYGRLKDAIRYRGELLNLPNIEGAAVSQNQPIL